MGLIAHYPLNGNANDAHGLNHGAAYVNTWEPAKVNSALGLTRTEGSRVEIPHDPEVSRKVFGVGKVFSFSVWINLDGYYSHGIIVGKQSDGSYSNTTSALWVDGNGVRMMMGCNTAGNPSGGSITAAYKPSAGEWHHIAGVADGEFIKLYVGGVLRASRPISELTQPRSENTSPIRIGGRTSSSADGLAGSVRDLRIYDHALSQLEVRDLSLDLALHLKMLDGTDASNTSKDISLVNDPLQDGALVNSDDGGRKVIVNDPPVITGSASYAFWIKPANRDRRMTFWNMSYAGEGTINQETTGKLRIYAGPQGEDAYISHDSADIPIGEWTHAVAVRDLEAGEIRWYLNGKLSTTRTHTMGQTKITGNPLTLGSGYTSDFMGDLRDVRYYASVLSEDAILELYQRRASLDDKGNLHANQIIEHLGDKPGLDIVVRSSGYEDGNVSDILIGGEQYSYALRGFNLVLMSPSGHVVSQGGFDTHDHAGHTVDGVYDAEGDAELAMVDYLRSVRDGDYILISTRDQPRTGSAELAAELAKIEVDLSAIGNRDGYAAIIRKGGGMIGEMLAPRADGVVAEVTHTVAASPSAKEWFEAPSFSEIGISRNLVGWYPLQVDPNDLAGASDGLVEGPALDRDGYEWSTESQVIRVEGQPADMITGSFTLAARVYLDSTILAAYPEESRNIVARHNNSAFRWRVREGQNTWLLINDGDAYQIHQLDYPFPTDTWVNHMVVADLKAGVVKFYLDGVKIGEVASSKLSVAETDERTMLGGYNGVGESWAGRIQDIRIYNDALSDGEIAKLNHYMTPDTQTRASFDRDAVTLKGQIREVIS
ncbi:LamG-like jellyroll fold domain-containing protein [Cobetia sp. SIMBA_158]|uniref:LamG-like jellyroll fold domain-containing protein n=1 Tax=Cobetia sp. SIMBA_158 TaxID=3081617 RepID=UPI00397FD209